MRRLFRLAVATGLALGALVLAGGVALQLASGSRRVQEAVRSRILGLLRRALDGEVELGAVSGSLGRTLVLDDLRLGVRGRTVVRVPRLEIAYAPLALLRGRVRLTQVTLLAPRVRAVHDREGWRFPAQRRGGASGRTRLSVELRRIEVRDGRVAAALLEEDPPRRFAAAGIQVAAAAVLGAGRSELRVTTLRFTPRGLAVSPVEVSGELGAAHGGVEVRGLRIGTARSHLIASGRLDPGRRFEARLTLDPLAAGETRALLPGLRLRHDVRASLNAAGPWSRIVLGLRSDLGPAGSIAGAVRADLTAVPVRYAARMRFAGLDPGGAIDGLVPAHLDGHAEAAGQGLGRQASLTYGLRLGPSEIAGQHVEELAVQGAAAGGTHRARARLEHAAGEVVARARVVLGPTLAYRMRSRLRLDHVEALAPMLDGAAIGRLSLAGSGTDAATRRADLRADLLYASLRGIPLARGEARARLEGDLLRLAAAKVEGPALRAAASGSLDLARRAADFSLDAAGDLHGLASRPDTPLAGSFSAHATARGPLAALTVAATATGEGLAYGSLSAEHGSGTCAASGLGGAAPAGTARLVLAGARVGARAPQELTATLTWQRVAAADRASVESSLRGEHGMTGTLALRLERTGDSTRGEVRAFTLAPPEGPTWRLAAPAGFAIDDGMTTTGVALTAGAQAISLTGHLSTVARNDASLALTRLELAPLCRLVASARCAGFLSGRVAVTGSAAAPELQATLTATRLRAEDADYGTLEVEALYAERSVSLRAALDHPEAGQLRLEGRVPVDLAWRGPRPDLGRAPVDLVLRAEGLDLTFARTLFPSRLAESAGRLAIDLRLAGPRAAPQMTGFIALDAGRLELAAAGLPYEDVRLRMTAAGRTLEVTELHARGGDGALDGAGRVRIGLDGSSQLGLTLRLTDFLAVRRRAYEAALGGNLEVGGSLRAPEIAGRLEVEHAILRPARLPASEPPLEADPTIAVVNGEEAAVAPPPAPPPAPADPVRLAVDMDLGRDAWIRRSDANIELGGNLHLDKAPFAPARLDGRIVLVRGWGAFQGRRFEIDEGAITFSGTAQPHLDVRASYRAGLYRIQVHVEGAGEKPTLTLSSDPPLEQADILAVLLYGKPTGELGRGQSLGLQQKALDLAAGYAAPELRTSVMNALGLDALDVELPGDETTPGRVSVGRYVGGDIFVSLAQEFGSRGAEVVSVEYGVTPSIAVRGSTSSRGAGGVDVFWHRRY